MLHMEERHLKIVQEILRKYPYDFYAFGSRVKGLQRALSDLDLAFKDPIPLNIISTIEEDFKESDLPFKLDLVDFSSCTQEFKERIEKDLVLIPKLTKTYSA